MSAVSRGRLTEVPTTRKRRTTAKVTHNNECVYRKRIRQSVQANPVCRRKAGRSLKVSHRQQRTFEAAKRTFSTHAAASASNTMRRGLAKSIAAETGGMLVVRPIAVSLVWFNVWHALPCPFCLITCTSARFHRRVPVQSRVWLFQPLWVYLHATPFRFYGYGERAWFQPTLAALVCQPGRVVDDTSGIVPPILRTCHRTLDYSALEKHERRR